MSWKEARRRRGRGEGEQDARKERMGLKLGGKGEGRAVHRPLDLNEVSVKFVGLGRALPTFSLGFWKSAFLFFCLRVEEPMAGDLVDSGRSVGALLYAPAAGAGQKG